MTDISQAKPSITSFKSMVFTGLGSGAAGDQIGDAFSDIINWIIQVKCACIPPIAVSNAIHTLMVVSVMAGAFWIHFLIVKPKGD